MAPLPREAGACQSEFGTPTGQPYGIAEVVRMHVQVCDNQAKNALRFSLVVPDPEEGEFENVRALDNRRSTARHNSIGAPKPPGFSGNLTTG